MEDLLKDLNPQQKEAVSAPLMPVCVLAGAGSGKTTVLTRRIAWLIQHEGVAPEKILAVTFTKKAAEEMEERVKKYLPAGTPAPHLSTFHSLGNLILRQEIDYVEELESGFAIIDNYQQKAYVQAAMRENGYDPDTERTGTFMGLINKWKGKQLTADEAYKKLPHKPETEKYFAVYYTYEQMLRDDNKADFTDLLFLTAQLFDRNKEIVEKYRRIYPYILVDEYQDTSPLQYKILFDLAGKADNLYVVGDNDQAIYGFRGADMSIILNFQRDFENAKVITLEKNYRSSPKIVEAANGVIANNKERFDKKLVSTRKSKTLIEAHQAYDPEQEAEWLTENIKEAVKSGKRKYSDFTVLVRNNSLTAPVETALSHAHIPYTVVGGKSFFERMEVLDVIAYMKFILNPDDWQAFSRIANKPARRFAKASLKKLKDEIDSGATTLVDFLEETGRSYKRFCTKGAGVYGKLRIGKMYLNSDKLRQNPDANMADIITTILADDDDGGLGYESFLKKMAEPAEMTAIREDNIYCLLAMAHKNETLEDFLARFERIKKLVKTDLSELNSVKIMTIHGAKGLEFPVVYIVGAEERIIPSWHCGDNETIIEEERRVFYVAMTRARDELHISSCYKRQVRDNVETRDPSRFAYEIPEDAFSGKWVMDEMELEKCEAEALWM